MGSLPATDCGVEYDGENEGHNGFQANVIANDGLLPGWLQTSGIPDVVTVHLGTNDLWKNPSMSTETIVAAYEDLLEDMRAANPNVKVIVSAFLHPFLLFPPSLRFYPSSG